MGNTIEIKKVDLLHFFAAPQIQQQTWIENFIGDELEPLMNKDAKFLAQYYSYLLSCMGTRDQRRYNTLRQALRINQIIHRPTLFANLLNVVKQSGLDTDFIENVYDIGCGLSIWHELLQQIFPNAKIWRVDKDKSVHPDIWLNLSEFVTAKFEKCESHQTVVFLSDTLHCKAHLPTLLYRLEKCVTIINESIPEYFLEMRLQESGGQLYFSQDLCPSYKGWSTLNYETALSHYISIRLPEKEES